MTCRDSTEVQRLETLERNDGAEQVRISLDEFIDLNGRPHRYVSVRRWYRKDDGQWCPTKSGITVRKRELLLVGKALRTALDLLNGDDHD